jgi:hypothetical protein
MTQPRRGWVDTADLPIRRVVATAGSVGTVPDPRPTMAAARRVAPDLPSGWGVGSRPPIRPTKTVYLTINRPDGRGNASWRALVSMVRSLVFAYTVQELATRLDADDPAVQWVLIMPVMDVVAVQAELLEALGVGATAIWSEAIPRTIEQRPGG